jgi:hypothetical protein
MIQPFRAGLASLNGGVILTAAMNRSSFASLRMTIHEGDMTLAQDDNS